MNATNTLREQIGQMLLFGWNGDSEDERLDPGPHALTLIDELAAGGVILMGRNAKGADRLRNTIAALQARHAALGRPPLFMAVDQEGGRVQRLGAPDFTVIPPAGEIGDQGDPQIAYDWAALTARELRDVGINWDFAPVLDVNNNPANPVIGRRSYSDNPAAAAEMGVATIRGFQENGVFACAKHFPGHGDTDVDSHHALPVIKHSRDRLDAVELAPFRAAIEADVAAIMTAHIVFPSLDPDRPATLSPAVLGGLLRGELGFEGLVITDDLDMRGVADGWGAAEAAVLAVLAGADILLCCHSLEKQRLIQSGLIDAVETGRISRDRIQESLTRIARAKRLLSTSSAI